MSKSLIYEERVPQSERKAFTDKVRKISSDLEINPNWLMAVMNFESARTFSPSVQNSKTGATGLIQFMPDTAKDLGTSINELRNMSATKQLDYVYKYYNQSWIRPKLLRYVDLYLATIFPRALGKPDSYVIQNEPKFSAKTFTSQNPSFDRAGDNNSITTVKEISDFKLSQIPSEWRSNFLGEMDTVSKKFRRYYGLEIALILIILLSILSIGYFKFFAKNR
jgi:hypothetical protein